MEYAWTKNVPVVAGPLDRRRFLTLMGGLATVAVAAQGTVDEAEAAETVKLAYPFSLGVASGDPTPTGIVLWTRLAPTPLVAGGGVPPRDLTVRWELFADRSARRVVRSGRVRAPRSLAHSVHVEVDGLRPDTEYYYRFRYRNHASTLGRTRTAPLTRSRLSAMTFAVVSCQDWQSGFYPVYRHLIEDDVSLVLHLGDYVYEGDIDPAGGLRRQVLPAAVRKAPRTVDEWRVRYGVYKLDPDLQAAHAHVPFLVTWDDHEVQNDYAGTTSQYEGDITARRAAAYQAYYEHQPLRAASIPNPGGGLKLYRGLTFGDLINLSVLDGRQHRTVPPGGWGEAPANRASYDPSVTMLGFRQERWLTRRLIRSDARWTVLGNNVLMARLEHEATPGARLWHDGWDGFPGARKRIADVLVDAKVANPIVLSGDWHSTFVSDILRDFDRPESRTVTSEFVVTSVSTNGDSIVYGPYYGPMIGFNPHIKFFDGDRRGYLRCRVNRNRWRTDLRMVDSVATRTARVSTLASFVVEAGRRGVQRA